MKTSKTLFAIIICLTIAHQSCVYDRFDGRLEIVNLSGVSISIDDGQGPTPEYPSLNQTEYFLRDTIAVDEKKSLIQTNLDWSKYIKKSKNKRLNLFIYNLDTLKKYDDNQYFDQKFKLQENNVNRKRTRFPSLEGRNKT